MKVRELLALLRDVDQDSEFEVSMNGGEYYSGVDVESVVIEDGLVMLDL
jgi:hypothetical protein